ncbi:MAG: glycosyltransferase [Caulobacteraceae bacterium]|nr:glycosyltransferase [Caulobacteraceae bacterium]
MVEIPTADKAAPQDHSPIGGPYVSVIVPHYQDLPRLKLCLDALGRQTFPRERFEIIVADNNSPCGESAVAEAIAGRARLTIVREKGAGPARNGGVALARGLILAFTDSDCVPQPQWLEEGLKGLESADFVGGTVEVLVPDPDNMTPVECFERVFAFDFRTYILKKEFTGSGNLFCPRKVFDAVGGFASGVSEDVEWCMRARAAGYSIGFAPRAAIGHPARRTWSEMQIRWKRLNSESYHLAQRDPGGRAKWLIKTLLMPASAVVHTVKVLTSPRLERFSDRIKAIGVLYRIRWFRMIDGLWLLSRR